MVGGDDKNDMGYLYKAMDHAKLELDLGSNALTFNAIRMLSQTTSTSQCERNWSTFNLIHSKV
ncbi:hypothetical protein Taro_015293 [Colocasia esculenta]|uniref:HAT C-terminal dimerisation domain-containing protein n=1 Tax=Colocasia esculenta TaxID=4460 RepID=A0A843UHD6_COLES|nr:hypothetical protein [Colocasia esculenta]